MNKCMTEISLGLKDIQTDDPDPWLYKCSPFYLFLSRLQPIYMSGCLERNSQPLPEKGSKLISLSSQWLNS